MQLFLNRTLSRIRLLSIQEATTRRLFSTFFQTPKARDILEITTACMEFDQIEDDYGFRGYLVGTIFEELAAIHLRRSAGAQFRFLTSDDFVKLYREIDPTAKICADCFGISHGITANIIRFIYL